jgi:hypothetical protein
MMENFCDVSGQWVSKDKSWVLFSNNTQVTVKDSICSELGLRETQALDKYLGFPLKSHGRGQNDFNFVVHRVQNKLAGWKASLLSMAGRHVLIQSVTSAIPEYLMQGTLLPAKVCKKVDKVNRNFLWGSTLVKKKVHMVRWEKVTRPKKFGGLGLVAARPRNLALLAKLNWRMMNEEEAPWARMLKAKYLGPRGNFLVRKPCSRTWSACKAGEDILYQGLRKFVRSGNSTSFWNERWSSAGSLRHNMIGPLNRNEERRIFWSPMS